MSHKKIALIGADGQLGSDLARVLKSDELHPLFFPEFDITQKEQMREKLFRLEPDTVINTAAYHRVDECEDYPERAFQVNAVAVRNLAQACRDCRSVLVHFSTDYVFDGLKGRPYVEDDIPHPQSVYAASKLAGEHLIRGCLERSFVVRTCGLYGEAGCREKGGGNFVDGIISASEEGRPLRIVNDQRVTPTSTLELAHRISELIRTDSYGLFHLTNEGSCTWFDFAKEVFDLLGRTPDLQAVDSDTLGAKARRPTYSVLENRRAKQIGLTPFSPWEDALRDYLTRKGYSPHK